MPVRLSYLKGDTFRRKGADSPTVKQVRKVIEDYIDEHYPILPLHKLATFLDPRFVQLSPFLPEYERKPFLQEVFQLAKELVEDAQGGLGPASVPCNPHSCHSCF